MFLQRTLFSVIIAICFSLVVCSETRAGQVTTRSELARSVRASWQPYRLPVRSYILKITKGETTDTYETADTKISFELLPGRYSAELAALLTDGRMTASTSLHELIVPLGEDAQERYHDFVGSGVSNIMFMQGDRLTVLSAPKDGTAYHLSIPEGTKFLSTFLGESSQVVAAIPAGNSLSWRLLNTLKDESLDLGTFGEVGSVPISDCRVKGKGILAIAKRKGSKTEVQMTIGGTKRSFTINERASELFCSYTPTSSIIVVRKEKSGLRFIQYNLKGKIVGNTAVLPARGIPFLLPTSSLHKRLIAGIVTNKGDIYTTQFKDKKIVVSKSAFHSELPKSISVGEDATSLFIIAKYKDGSSTIATFDNDSFLATTSERLPSIDGMLFEQSTFRRGLVGIS